MKCLPSILSLLSNLIGSLSGSFFAWLLSAKNEKNKNKNSIEKRMGEILFLFSENLYIVYSIGKRLAEKSHTNLQLKTWLTDGVISFQNRKSIKKSVAETLVKYQGNNGIWKMTFKWDDIKLDIFNYETIRKNKSLNKGTIYSALHKLYIHIDTLSKVVESINANADKAFSKSGKMESLTSKCTYILHDCNELFLIAPGLKELCLIDDKHWDEAVSDLCEMLCPGSSQIS